MAALQFFPKVVLKTKTTRACTGSAIGWERLTRFAVCPILELSYDGGTRLSGEAIVVHSILLPIAHHWSIDRFDPQHEGRKRYSHRWIKGALGAGFEGIALPIIPHHFTRAGKKLQSGQAWTGGQSHGIKVYPRAKPEARVPSCSFHFGTSRHRIHLQLMIYRAMRRRIWGLGITRQPIEPEHLIMRPIAFNTLGSDPPRWFGPPVTSCYRSINRE